MKERKKDERVEKGKRKETIDANLACNDGPIEGELEDDFPGDESEQNKEELLEDG